MDSFHIVMNTYSPNALHSTNLLKSTSKLNRKRQPNNFSNFKITFMKLIGALGQSDGIHM